MRSVYPKVRASLLSSPPLRLSFLLPYPFYIHFRFTGRPYMLHFFCTVWHSHCTVGLFDFSWTTFFHDVKPYLLNGIINYWAFRFMKESLKGYYNFTHIREQTICKNMNHLNRTISRYTLERKWKWQVMSRHIISSCTWSRAYLINLHSEFSKEQNIIGKTVILHFPLIFY